MTILRVPESISVTSGLHSQSPSRGAPLSSRAAPGDETGTALILVTRISVIPKAIYIYRYEPNHAADRCDRLWLGDELSPCVAGGVNDGVVGLEDAVR